MPKTEEQLNILKEARRREIAVCGLKVFCEKGYESATVDDIVSRANCSHGLFYHYFSSKEDLFDEVMKMKYEKADKKLDEKIAAAKCCKDKLKLIIDALFHNMESDENFPYHYYFFVSRCFERNEKGRVGAPKKPPKKPLHAKIEEIFEEGIVSGEFGSRRSAKECTELVMYIIHGATLDYVIAPKDQPRMKLPNSDLITGLFV